jgi:signal transduction histidine kinase
LASATSCVVILYERRRVLQAVESVRNAEKVAALQLVVGYICHELRNPLHIIKTSFRALVAVPSVASRLQNVKVQSVQSDAIDELGALEVLESLLTDDNDAPQDDELRTIVADATVALHQMQRTVNEVLDYRAISSGLSSLKLDRTPFVLGKVTVGVAMC